MRNLKGDAGATPDFGFFRPRDPDELLVTSTGQVLTSLGGVNVETLNRQEAASRLMRRIR